MESQDVTFMRRAIALAARGCGAVEPNPMVGCVLVRDGAVIAVGFHTKLGAPHAARAALSAAAHRGAEVRGATAYVTLEPCSHYGKTPPCADGLIEAGLGRVVVAIEDPDSQVAGRGVAKLREAGIAVEVGCCAEDVRHQLAPYIKHRTTARPWVIAKWAQTADGYLALPAGQGQWITGSAARAHVHKIRGTLGAIAVGIGTVLADDPMLTNRSGHGRQPLRIVVDSRLTIPPTCQLVTTAAEFGLLLATTQAAADASSEQVAQLTLAGVEILPLAENFTGRVALESLLDALGARGIVTLQIEGGATLLDALLDGNLADELQVYTSQQVVGTPLSEQALPRLPLAEILAEGGWGLCSEEQLSDDYFYSYLK
jgi:diaminohydroxyphosphoribosylaminopyrimidine deaminase/5-amino-6-(5-phosphoribosylamino)uracil reductase